MNRINQAFADARRDGRTLFIAYLMGGDPNLKQTAALVPALEKAGVGLIELGVPFSDPIADGVVNQKAASRALTGGTTLNKLLDTIEAIRKTSQIPLVLFSYLNPILQMGLDSFAARAAKAGVDGVLCVDLPPEEASPCAEKLKSAGLKNIFLLAPTTPDDRIKKIDRLASGFLYYVSRLGVTGVRDTLDSELEKRLQQVKKLITHPLAVGFGISTPEHIRKLSTLCDAIVVGSAIVQKIEEVGDKKNLAEEISSFVKTLTQELRHAKT